MAWGAGLDEAAGRLVEQWERDLEEVVVCLPGSGAGRRLAVEAERDMFGEPR